MKRIALISSVILATATMATSPAMAVTHHSASYPSPFRATIKAGHTAPISLHLPFTNASNNLPAMALVPVSTGSHGGLQYASLVAGEGTSHWFPARDIKLESTMSSANLRISVPQNTSPGLYEAGFEIVEFLHQRALINPTHDKIADTTLKAQRFLIPIEVTVPGRVKAEAPIIDVFSGSNYPNFTGEVSALIIQNNEHAVLKRKLPVTVTVSLHGKTVARTRDTFRNIQPASSLESDWIPWKFKLQAGTYIVRVSAPGAQSRSFRVRISARFARESNRNLNGPHLQPIASNLTPVTTHPATLPSHPHTRGYSEVISDVVAGIMGAGLLTSLMMLFRNRKHD